MRRGFTPLEIVVMIFVVAVMLVVAIPRFLDLREESRQTVRENIDSAIEVGERLWREKQAAYD